MKKIVTLTIYFLSLLAVNHANAGPTEATQSTVDQSQSYEVSQSQEIKDEAISPSITIEVKAKKTTPKLNKEISKRDLPTNKRQDKKESDKEIVNSNQKREIRTKKTSKQINPRLKIKNSNIRVLNSAELEEIEALALDLDDSGKRNNEEESVKFANLPDQSKANNVSVGKDPLIVNIEGPPGVIPPSDASYTTVNGIQLQIEVIP